MRETRIGHVSVNKRGYRPTREAVFTETMQIGIVARDLDATLRWYVDDYHAAEKVRVMVGETAKPVASTQIYPGIASVEADFGERSRLSGSFSAAC